MGARAPKTDYVGPPLPTPQNTNIVYLMASIVCDDRFSELPYDIGQKILSCLNLKERATSCLVLRNWYHMITSLDYRKFVQTSPSNISQICTNISFNQILLEFCRTCSALRTVIKVAADNTTLTEIYLFVPISSAFFKFSPAVFDSRLLTVVHLKLCEINGNAIKEFPCLKEIHFYLRA
ncbi:hypothetical protein H5410_025800 [Solanum commersonii]|uniref:F-box domain-containing protein n=1 Tax=Solanum commersonii TaxID=4109 RepID=A0A9J5YYZ1_SOLCO|nr:hypothetical protein H5410_025800 [Solanum commersonii]